MWPCDIPLMLACQLALSLCRACLGGHITMLWFYGFRSLCLADTFQQLALLFWLLRLSDSSSMKFSKPWLVGLLFWTMTGQSIMVRSLKRTNLVSRQKEKKERGRRWNHGYTVVVKGTPTMTWTPLPNACLLKFPPLPRSTTHIFKKMDSRGKSRAKPQLYMREIGNFLPDKHVSLFSLMHTSWERVRFL